MSISVDDVEALRSILSSLPRHQPKQVSKQDAIASLVSELAAAQRRGYTADDLAQLMSERGIDINGPTLRNCLRRLRKKRPTRSKATPSQGDGANAAASSPVTAADKKVANVAAIDGPKPSAPAPVRQLSQPSADGRLIPSDQDRPPVK